MVKHTQTILRRIVLACLTILWDWCLKKVKVEKVKFFTQSPTKIFCIDGFNVGVCLASYLTFRPFLTLGP